MTHRSLIVLASLAVLMATPVAAQTYYGGYDIGPDYGAILDQALEQDRQLGLKIQQYERQVTEQAMADPICRRLYTDHQQQGGQLPYPNFAYLCWATRYFTPDGIAYFQQTERDNWNKERLAIIDLRRMEAIRGEAQNELNATIQNNNLALGAVIAGKNTYLDPYSGTAVDLPNFSEPNQMHWDHATQSYYTMDTTGQVVKWQNGAWEPVHRPPRQ